MKMSRLPHGAPGLIAPESLIATYIPARRAAGLDPLEALKR